MVAQKKDNNTLAPTANISVGKTFKIETANGIYELKKPMGKIGALHFRLLTKAMPKGSSGEEDGGVSPADQDRLQEVFEQWSDQVLPVIVCEPMTYDDIPGEDQWILFLAMFQTMNISTDLFRIVS